MSYVGAPFVHDIFVSYSHGDPDGSGESRLKQWSQGFVRELEAELRAQPKFGRDLRIFLDQHARPSQGIDPMTGLTEQLREDLRGSAILAVLMTPHYLQSAWCKDEREWWHAAQGELGLALDGRIAVSRVWPTDGQPWPAEMVDERGHPFTGFFFYDRAHADVRPQPYEWPMPDERSKGAFRDALLDLVASVGQKLTDVRQRLEERRRALEAASRLAQPAGQVVYLHGRVEQSREWDRASDALSQAGFVVLPGEPDPVVSDALRLQEIRQQRVQTLSGCDALLLVATDNGRAADADLVVVGRQDRYSARAMSHRLLPCALLDNAGPVVATAKRKVAARSLNVEWIDATRDPWTPAVQQWLHGVASTEATP